VEASPAQPTETTATPATSLSENIPSGTAAVEVKGKESSPPALKQPNAPVSPTWSVAVSTDPYPSIRIPEDISSQKPSIGRSLQIGRAISRVEPVYPEDAKRQGIEGTVKLHVVVGGDGSVERVELTSGPALLAKAATSAIREWRYGQTLLGGQPVETEQDVVVKFRLAGPSNSKN
jgi:TonB family protein